MGARTDGENCLGQTNLLLRSSEEPQLARWWAPPQLAAKGLLHPAQWDTPMGYSNGITYSIGLSDCGTNGAASVHIIATKRPD